MNKFHRAGVSALALLLVFTLLFAMSSCFGEEKKTQEASDEPTLDLTTKAPTDEPTEVGTVLSTEERTDGKTDEKTEGKTDAVTGVPTEAKTDAPTEAKSDAPTEAKSDATTDGKTEGVTESATTGAAYGSESFADCEEITLSGTPLSGGALYDAAAGTVSNGNLVSLYDLCPTLDGVRVYALVDDKVTLSHEAATALAQLSESAYRETGMRVHLRTVDHMKEGDAGYADYASRYSVKIGYYEDVYYGFDAEKTAPLADYIRANAHNYGFIELSSKDDAGHFRYVGIPHAAVMHDHAIKTLAEYHVFLAGKTGALKVSFEDVNYYIQSFAVTEGAATVRVPKQYKNQYTLSATGNGSVVMTVTAYASGLGNRLPYVAEADADRSTTVICLDAGHGAHDPGAVWPQNSSNPTYLEKEYNLEVALQAKAYLEAMGYKVILTRTDDSFVELSNRVSFAKQYGADLFVSFHCNSTANPDSPTAVGPQVYFNQSEKTQFLNWTIARAFRNALNEGTAAYIGEGKAHPVEESDLRNGNYTVLSDLVLPSVLLEMGFITNEGDRALFEDTRWQEAMGYSVALAVETLFANDQLK